MNVDDKLLLTVKIVSAYVSNNPLPAGDLKSLISNVHTSFETLEGRQVVEPTKPLVPAVNPKNSVRPDYIVCLDDGLKFSSLKRHIGKLGMTPEQYIEKWGLPKDYPMVAPNYSARRSALAKKMGLGRGGGRRKKVA